MCANATPTTSLSSPAPSTGRSLFSRLTSPLRSRSRNLTDFHIKADEPHRHYSPGDLVKGTVVLTVVKPIGITHLTVCLHGFVRVFKSANGAKDPVPDIAVSGTTRKSQYFGNGHASLFQDEQILCGKGRLEAGEYQFQFELEFPSEGLPSSVDFERGTISYMITATITRPTSITATSSCEQKVFLVETVDIGPIPAQKPRTISLEPISRRTRRRKVIRTKETGSHEHADTGSGSDAARAAGSAATSPLPDDSASQIGSTDHHTTSQSSTSNENQSTVSAPASAESTISSSTGLSFRLAPAPSSAKSVRESKRTGSKVSVEDKTITATIELLKAGCLPGDNIPLKIAIKHTKAIKSMHGIIITLYRQGRIDSAPPLSLFSDISEKDAERLKHEEYYPKSKTGLGGLSLSSAGSSSMFRKDLAQTFAPILIDPTTLSAVINASVRVPVDVFPTIGKVPGQMISFKYYIEVVVDLGGKLANQQRHVPRVGAITLPTTYNSASGSRGDPNSNMLAAWGGSLVDTDHIRREKSVACSVFEVVVGTKDSARTRRRGNSSVSRRMADWTEETSATSPGVHEPIYEEHVASHNGTQNGGYPDQPYPYYEENYHEQNPDYYQNEGYEYRDFSYDQYPPPSHAHIPVPPPEMLPEEGLSDKERARRAEQRLLPSQPPTDNAGPSSPAPIDPTAPSAPSAIQEDIYSMNDSTPEYQPNPDTITEQHNPLLREHSATTTIGASAPSLSDLHPSASHLPTEDKQELERRRLLEEASAPSQFQADGDEEDDVTNAGEGSSSHPPHSQSSRNEEQEPSAPILSDEDEYGGGYQYSNRNYVVGSSSSAAAAAAAGDEALPKYER